MRSFVVASASAALETLPSTPALLISRSIFVIGRRRHHEPTHERPHRLRHRGSTPARRPICVIAAIGFAFDIYELLMLPLMVRPALQELRRGTGLSGVPDVGWTAVLCSGVCRRHLRPVRRLPDRPARPPARAHLEHPALRRRRVLRGLLDVRRMLLTLRPRFIGVCVEFVAAVAWLAELFPDPMRREKVLGYTQAFSSIGGLLVATRTGMHHYAATCRR